jgi:hypothetical protein
MLLALTCALCTIQPIALTPAGSLPEPRLSLQETGPTIPAPPLRLASARPLAASQTAPAPLASLPMQDTGSGDGDHSDHMSSMWIVMGAVMVVMMVGVGAYAMSHRSVAAGPSSTTTVASPALLAIPVVARGGG